jgi:hypothetical protein
MQADNIFWVASFCGSSPVGCILPLSRQFLTDFLSENGYYTVFDHAESDFGISSSIFLKRRAVLAITCFVESEMGSTLTLELHNSATNLTISTKLSVHLWRFIVVLLAAAPFHDIWWLLQTACWPKSSKISGFDGFSFQKSRRNENFLTQLAMHL